MRCQFRAESGRPDLGHGRNAMNRPNLWWLPLLAATGIALAAPDASAQSLTNFNVAPRVTPMAPVTPISPRIQPRINYDKKFKLQGHNDGPSADAGNAPKSQRHTKKAAKGSSGPSNQSAQNSRAYVPPLSERRFRPNEVIIEVVGSPNAAFVDALANRHQLQRLESQYFETTGSTFYRWQVPPGRSVRSVLTALGNDSNITRVQPNIITTLQQQSELASLPRGAEVDPAQYAVRKLHLIQAHGLARGDNVLVAVIDSGVDVTHPELAGVIAATFDPLKSSEGPHAHGTAVAGLIAAHARLTGAAPRAQILAVRAFTVSGNSAESTTFAILKSLEWSVKRGARVINMSFAGPFDPAVGRALATAHKKGIVLVAAAGNAGPKSPPLFPAADPNVIAVTATDIDDRLFPASNRGRHIAVAAPGVDILAPAPDGRYQVSSGTSFAAPQVSGIAALLIGGRPDLTPDMVRHFLMASAKDLGPKGRDSQFGAGLADALTAIRAAQQGAINAAANVPLPPTPVRVRR
jgi:subtilisin family serine protease